MPERGKILKNVTKDITWAKGEASRLKHDVFSCPKVHEKELNEQLTNLTEKMEKYEKRLDIRQRKFDRDQSYGSKTNNANMNEPIDLNEAPLEVVADRGIEL